MKYVGRVLLNAYLKKRSNILHLWNTRLCILTENYLITYKQTENNETKITNSIYLPECVNVKNSEQHLNKDFSFELIHKDKIYYFICKDKFEQIEWIKEIKKAIINIRNDSVIK